MCRLASQVAERQEIRKFQENPLNAWIYLRVPRRPPKIQISTLVGQKVQKSSCKTFHRKTYFTWVREFVSNPLHNIVRVIEKIAKLKYWLTKEISDFLKLATNRIMKPKFRKCTSMGFSFLFLTISHVPVQKRVFKLTCLQSGFNLCKFTWKVVGILIKHVW